jgi:hypothetical protein
MDPRRARQSRAGFNLTLLREKLAAGLRDYAAALDFDRHAELECRVARLERLLTSHGLHEQTKDADRSTTSAESSEESPKLDRGQSLMLTKPRQRLLDV